MKNIEKQGLSDGQGISLRELWRIALKRKWIVIASALAVLTVATLISFLTVPMYTAKGQILIEREPNILSFQDIFQIETFNDEYYQTQYKLLQSRALAGDTIDRMKLYENEEFLKGVVKDTGGGGGDLKSDPLLRRKLSSKLLRRLTIRPVAEDAACPSQLQRP